MFFLQRYDKGTPNCGRGWEFYSIFVLLCRTTILILLFCYVNFFSVEILLVIRTLVSHSNKSAIRSNVGSDGWITLLHHFETVVFNTPNCSASHIPVLFFSTNTSFRRFKSLPCIFNSFNSDAKFRHFLWKNNNF